jgi:hypothetical protein
MSLPLLILWALVGWCGTVLRPYPYPRVPDPPLPPDPPICLVCGVIGAVVGIVGGWVFTQVFLPQDPIPMRSGVYAAATSVGAFVASRFASSIYGQFFNRAR